jgi:hypothetical protein
MTTMASTNKAIAVQRWLLVGVLASAAFLGTRHVVFGEEGSYSCCGDSTCTYLHAGCACPSGDGQCEFARCGSSYDHCCQQRCFSP